ncbi:rhodanese-like domain-containing protein [Spirosoma aerophilum]
MLTILKSIFGSAEKENITELLAQGAVLIDVRSAGEFAGGHAKGAVNIPLDQLDNQLNKIKAYHKPIVLCCASGMRSARAKNWLAGQGVSDLHDAGGWRSIKL